MQAIEGACPSSGEDCPMEHKPSSVMTIEELSDYLKILRSMLYKLAQEGKVPCQKVGRHWRFRKEAIDRWLEQGGSNEMKAGVGSS